MIALKEAPEMEQYVIIHPLFDVPEQKHNADVIGKRKLGRGTRMTLIVLRGYVIVMGLVLAFHMLELAAHTVH